MHTTPLSLLERLRRPAAGEAWARFVELYSPLIYHWGRRAGLIDADATDLVQDVLMTLVRKMPDFRYDRNGSFRAWLRTVTLNRWRDYRKRPRATLMASDALDAIAAPEGEGLDQFWEAEYRAGLVRRALDLIRDEFRPETWRAWWESTVGGRSPAAIAADLGVTENAVYVARCRVLRRLRRELAGLLD